jgi:predicted nucleotidyltransferase
MKNNALHIPKSVLGAFCRRHGIRRLSVFGSVARGDEGPNSDVDVLVEFDPGRVPGFFALSDIEADLSRLVGRKVDLNTPGFFSGPVRERVVSESEVQYARAG